MLNLVKPDVYPKVNESRWNWDSDTKTMAHCMKSSLQNFGVIVSQTTKKGDIDVFDAYTMIDNII